jgi:hypothetical protein
MTFVERINNIATNLQTAKNNLAAAITGKGVTASGSDTFSSLVTKIGNIEASDTTMSLLLNARLLFDNKPDIFENSYGKFVKTGTVIDENLYPELLPYATEIVYSEESIIPAMSANSQDGWTISGSAGSMAIQDGYDQYYYMVDKNPSTYTKWKYPSNFSSKSTSVTVTLGFPTSYKIGKLQISVSASFSLRTSDGLQITSPVTIPAESPIKSDVLTFDPTVLNGLTFNYRTSTNTSTMNAYSQIYNIDVFSAQNKVPLETYNDQPLYIKYA